jgi:hypothetical protein
MRSVWKNHSGIWKDNTKSVQTFVNSYSTVANTDLDLTCINLQPTVMVYMRACCNITMLKYPFILSQSTWECCNITMLKNPFILSESIWVMQFSHCSIYTSVMFPAVNYLYTLTLEGSFLACTDLVLALSYSCDNYVNTPSPWFKIFSVLKPQYLNKSNRRWK